MQSIHVLLSFLLLYRSQVIIQIESADPTKPGWFWVPDSPLDDAAIILKQKLGSGLAENLFNFEIISSTYDSIDYIEFKSVIYSKVVKRFKIDDTTLVQSSTINFYSINPELAAFKLDPPADGVPGHVSIKSEYNIGIGNYYVGYVVQTPTEALLNTNLDYMLSTPTAVKAAASWIIHYYTNTPTKQTKIPTKLTNIPTILTQQPTKITKIPTILPTNIPTKIPTINPTKQTLIPTKMPAKNPSNIPTLLTKQPTIIPSMIPTNIPSVIPTKIPTINPTIIPTKYPSKIPTMIPTIPTLLTTLNMNNLTSNKLNSVAVTSIIIVSIICVLVIIIFSILLYRKQKNTIIKVENKNYNIGNNSENISKNDTQLKQSNILSNTKTGEQHIVVENNMELEPINDKTIAQQVFFNDLDINGATKGEIDFKEFQTKK